MLRRIAPLVVVAFVGVGVGVAMAQEHPVPVEEQVGIEHGVEEAEHGGGMPQLDASTYASQIFWLVIAFVVLYRLLATRALPRLTEIIEARQDRIGADLERAARLRDEAEAAAERYKQVVAEAQAKAAGEIKAMQEALSADAAKGQAALDADLAEKLAEAEARIGAAKDAALGQIRGVAVEVAQAAVRRLTGIDVPAAEVEATLGRVQEEAA